MSNLVNLLPPAFKEEVHYARRNTKLINWVMNGLIVLAVLIASLVIGGAYIDSSKPELQTDIDRTTSLIKEQELDKVKGQAEELSNGIKVLLNILTSQVLFSKLLDEMGKVMPPRTVLGDISLSSKVSGALDIVASGKSFDDATQIQVNLSAPDNVLFSRVDSISVSCTSSPPYPCTTSLRALFKDSAAVTYIPADTLGAPAEAEAEKK